MYQLNVPRYRRRILLSDRFFSLFHVCLSLETEKMTKHWCFFINSGAVNYHI